MAENSTMVRVGKESRPPTRRRRAQREAGVIVVHLSIGGDCLKINTGKRLVAFEMHPWMGPTPLKRNGDPSSRIPSGFYDAIDRWKSGGGVTIGDVCVVPELCRSCNGTGEERKAIAPRHFEITGVCKVCEGIKVQPHEHNGVPEVNSA